MTDRPSLPLPVRATLGLLIGLGGATAQISQEELVPAEGPGLFDQFGATVAAGGGFVAVGAPYDDTAAPAAGLVRIFRRNADGWFDYAQIAAAQPATSAHLGEALDFDGDTLAASARGLPPGAVHLFERVEGGPASWQPTDVLTPDGPCNGFGWDVAVAGDLAAVGVFEEFGRVFLYERVEGAWLLDTVLQPAGLQPGDLFGSSVALSGDTLVVGASHSHIDGGDGRVWVFEHDPRAEGEAWTVQAVLEPVDPPPHGGFGWAVDLSGDRLVVGAFENEDTGELPGAAYLFERDADGTWSETTQFVADADHVPASFGRAVAIDDDVVCVGAFQEVSGPEQVPAGRAYVFRDFAGTWAQVADLRAKASSEDDHFGRAVSVMAGMVAVGSPGKGLGGKAYVYLPVDKLGAWLDLGGAVAGFGGMAPELSGHGALTPGAETTLTLREGAPSAPAVLVLGFSSLGAPFLGGVLQPSPDVLLGLVLDAQGRFEVSWPWPADIPTGAPHLLQAWVQDAQAVAGWSASNGLSALAP